MPRSCRCARSRPTAINRLQIVCGAKNVRAGLKVAVATGRRFTCPNDVIIKRAKLRGLESNGMLCSARELGLGDEYDGHHGAAAFTEAE